MRTKEKIIERVNAINNPSIFDEILNLISVETNVSKNYKFNSDELIQVNEGLGNVEDGKIYSQKELDKIISKWLDEKSSGL